MMVKKIDEFEYGEPYFGICIPVYNYAVNLQSLWECTLGSGEKKVDNFIKNYSMVYIHEFLHKTLGITYNELFNEKEEEIVSRLTFYPEQLLIKRPTLQQVWTDND